MKKALVLALSLTLAGFAAQAQTAPAAASAPEKAASFSFTEVKYDFGKIKQGDIVEHVFKFKNTGKAPLVISNIGVSCGCTTPDWTREPIAPGKSGTITAKFNSAGKMGMQNKELSIESNAVPAAKLYLVGEVLDPAAPAPAAAEATVEAKTKVKDTDAKTKIKAKKS
jgi:Protein of unknown function (DUF1573)